VIVAAVVLAGGSTAAAVALLVQGSAPLAGSVPGLVGPLRYDIPLTPDLEPGNAGWCSYPLFSITGSVDDAGAGTCSPAVPPGAPVILGAGEPIGNERMLLKQAGLRLSRADRNLSLVWMVVSSRVAAVRVARHQLIAPRADFRLPNGWRAVVMFTSAQIRPLPLDRNGNAIPTTRARVHVASASRAVARSRSYVPGSGSAAPCAIGRVRVAGVRAQWEQVATSVPALGAAVAPGTLFSCARSWLSINGQSEAPSAAFLLNAQDPRRPAPEPPGLVPTSERGVFSDPSAEILARRAGIGWLLVQSRSVALANELLRAAHVEGSAAGAR
jgi:hypothetical protein